MAEPKMPPSLVIFDCDGVLVDSEVVSNQVLADNLARHGVPVDLEECMRLFVGITTGGVMEMLRVRGVNLPDNWVDDVDGETDTRLKQGVLLVPGICDLLDRLDQSGVPFCVASNGSVEKMQTTLGQNDLWDRFEDRMFSAISLGIAKPDPGLFLAAARHFAAPAKACVVIEDSPTGALAAKRAGMRCLGFTAHGDGARLRAEGAEIFGDMNQVPALLQL